jgi:hypothetical protein
MTKPIPQEIKEIIESGFKITVPSATSFRLSESPAYKALSGLSLKEMDVGWWDSETKKIILVELKGFEIWKEFDKSTETAHGHLMAVLNGKATDTLLMLAATWVGTNTGNRLQASLPSEAHRYPGEGNIKLIFLIDTPLSRRALLSPMKDAVNKELAGRMRLFGVRNVILVDLETAQKMALPIVRQN